MELSNLEKIWKEQDIKLSDKLSLNERLIKELMTNQARQESNSIRRFEMINLLIAIVVMFILTVWMIQYGYELIYLFSGLISISFLIVAFALAIRRLKLLTNLNQFYGPVNEMQRKISGMEKAYYKNKKIDLAILPIWVIAFFPVMMKGLAGIEFALVPMHYLAISIIVAVIFAYILAWLQYTFGYKAKMKGINAFLKRLDEFESEKV